MLEINSPINETQSFNNFAMEEKKPIIKINLRGDPNNKDFTSKVEKTLGIILPVEVGCIVIKDEISVIATGPNEWLITSNNTVKSDSNVYELENIL